MAEIKDFYGKILYKIEGDTIRDFYGKIVYKIRAFSGMISYRVSGSVSNRTIALLLAAINN